VADDQDAREFTRVKVKVEIAVDSESGTAPVRGAIRDASANGVFVTTSDTLPEGQPCTVTILLTGDPSGPVIRANGEIARSTAEGMAVRFTEILGENSFEHLRRLVMYNSRETGRVAEEFDEHLGIKRREL